jgi:hypothetical protein
MSQKNKKFQYKVTFWWVFTIFMSILTIIEEKKFLHPISNFWPLWGGGINCPNILNQRFPGVNHWNILPSSVMMLM